jgi:ParB family transcriptional regulator, chromosome partitioning protein
LGRGLDALLPAAGRGEEMESSSPLRQVPPSAIDANPNQPRKNFDDDTIAELSASIAELGVLQPLLVRQRSDGRFELIAGERRLRASQRAGLDTVPVLVVETDEQGSLERALVENIHRSDLNPIEEAAAYRQLLEDGGLRHEELAERLGRNRATVTHSLRLLELPSGIQKLLIEGSLSTGHGKALLALQGNPFQERLARLVATEGRSVRETEEQVRKYQSLSGTTTKGGSRPTQEQPLVAEAQQRLADALQTRVRVEMGKRKGKIVLDFVSLDELQRIMDSIVGNESRVSVVAPE